MEEYARIARRTDLPEGEAYLSLLGELSSILTNENPEYRPRDEKNRPGGLIRLRRLPTLIIPDLHGRREFLLRVLGFIPPDSPGGATVYEQLNAGDIQVVCVGDGFHAEARAADRWQKAFREFTGKYARHTAMDEEMTESLGLMEMVMRLKLAFPGFFHFLKGNHENISNEEGRGNHPFRKFSFEGEMVKDWVLKFYGRDFLETYAEFEHELPLLAADGNFMVSHAEPERFFTREEIIRYREYDDVVLGLTWTPDDGAGEGSVVQMIRAYCSEPEHAVYFGGHRPVRGLYNLRAENRYIQLHNPDAMIISLVDPEKIFDPERDILKLEEHHGEYPR